MNMIRERPLEVVLILDLNDFADDPVYTQGLRAAAITVLDSLTRQDMVSHHACLKELDNSLYN